MQEYQLVKYIPIGGLVSLAINETETYLLVTSHSGIGVFDLFSGERLARLNHEIYPENGKIKGIPPFSTGVVDVIEYDFENELVVYSNSSKYKVIGTSDTVTILKSVSE